MVVLTYLGVVCGCYDLFGCGLGWKTLHAADRRGRSIFSAVLLLYMPLVGAKITSQQLLKLQLIVTESEY